MTEQEKIERRNKAIKSIENSIKENEPFFKQDLEAVADWHIADIDRIVEPLLNIMPLHKDDIRQKYIYEYKEAVDETLRLSKGQ